MGTEKPPPDWRLGRQLLDKSLEMVREDPGTAVRLANLGVRISAILARGYDPFAELPKPKRRPRGKGRKAAP